MSELDENIWKTLSIQERAAELATILDQLLLIESGKHELSGTWQQGRLIGIKQALKKKITQITRMENGDL